MIRNFDHLTGWLVGRSVRRHSGGQSKSECKSVHLNEFNFPLHVDCRTGKSAAAPPPDYDQAKLRWSVKRLVQSVSLNISYISEIDKSVKQLRKVQSPYKYSIPPDSYFNFGNPGEGMDGGGNKPR